MDPALVAAAHALSRGDPLAALDRVALRTDPHALALRATALAQLGEYDAAKRWFRRATAGFGEAHPVAQARCVVGLADVALASRELSFPDAALARAITVLARHRDIANARYGQMLRARHALARGQLEVADDQLRSIVDRPASPALRALLALARAELSMRLSAAKPLGAALEDAKQAAHEAGIPALKAEVSVARQAYRRPVARLVSAGTSRLVTLDRVARLYASDRLVVDACRRAVRLGARTVDLSTRPVLFELVRRLAEAAPADVAREDLIRSGFGIQRASDSLRVRLRMSMARLRKLLAGGAEIVASPRGFALVARRPPVHLLLPPTDDESSQILALLSDGLAWSTSALALALGTSQRSVQRALNALAERGKVRTFGRGKHRRWLASPLTQFATPLLLPVASRRS